MLRRITRTTAWLFVAAVALTGSSAGAATQTLEDLRSSLGLNIDTSQISVSGISSGGYMAEQFHVAHSANVIGAGIVAGGPYYCARGDVMRGVSICTAYIEKFGTGARYKGPKTDEQAEALALQSYNEARKLSGVRIDDINGLQGDRMYLFTGKNDDVVPFQIMNALHSFYVDPSMVNAEPADIHFDKDLSVGHTYLIDNIERMPPGRHVNRCNTKPKPPHKNPFIDDCGCQVVKDISGEVCGISESDACATAKTRAEAICEQPGRVDVAGAVFQHIYPDWTWAPRQPLVDRTQHMDVPEFLWPIRLDRLLDEKIEKFDQYQLFKRTFGTDPIWASMSDTGFLYVPEACRAGAQCRLHVAFHGCRQGGGLNGGANFVKYAGYNEWAAANRVIVLYPQVRRAQTGVPFNPFGCWDLWGFNYTGQDYHTKSGKQIRAVAAMINALVGDSKFLAVPKN